ncbi:hypothetical protein [Aureivirga sp. CE67]|uniref:hypothetical protein n=1 Tax=Aureivirga sp. CE67 TaxID=1788983 RepID=UPI0018CA4427|nr:hypothetical protein [Aureivirga sp. CE67]
MKEIVDSNKSEILENLELEISLLEKELEKVSLELNLFQNEIRVALIHEIRHINKLEKLYKKQKLAKKAKRLAQKKKGKNYKEPKESIVSKTKPSKKETKTVSDKNLKQLYKESIVKIHPDKYANDSKEVQEKAANLTVELNDLYQKGDLRELENLYNHILSGNAFTSFSEQKSCENPEALEQYLKNKKEKIEAQLAEEKDSHLYFVLKNYKNPSSYISELKIIFKDRIFKLEKRTRYKKQK